MGSLDRVLPGHLVRVAGAYTDWNLLAKADADAPRISKGPTRAPSATASLSSASASSTTVVSRRQTNEDVSESTQSRAHIQHVAAGDASLSNDYLPTPSVSTTDRLRALLDADTLDTTVLKKLAWGGLPQHMRPDVWKALLDYMPSSSARREETIARKRQTYFDAVAQHYAPQPGSNAEKDDLTMRQISVDIPRTSPGIAMFRIPEVQAALERILYVWASRHPASGYVQGMNDLVTPFLYVFLNEHLSADSETNMLDWEDLSQLESGADALREAEADSYWCVTSLLNDIQDYFTFAQPGIQRRVHYLRDLVGRVDAPLRAHLEEEGLDFIQFSFRWMNCLLMRELPFPLIIRVWDTYLAEPDGFALFHVYVCAALLVWFSADLQEMEFQDMVMFLQNLPTKDWTTQEIDVILSQAYMWRTIFGAAPSHLH